MFIYVADSVEEYLKRKKAISNPKDIIDFLKLLIQRNGDNLLIYDGTTKNKTVSTNLLKPRLLFIVLFYDIMIMFPFVFMYQTGYRSLQRQICVVVHFKPQQS